MPDLVASVRSVLATSAARWTALARIEPELLARRPAPGEWSAIQCLQHVVDTELVVFRARVLALLDGRDFEAFDPEAQGHVDAVGEEPADLAEEFERARTECLAVLAGLTAADLSRTARHAEFGPVTLEQLLSEYAAHDAMHLVQAERALMQAFIPGSGPWRSSFSDHDADADADA